MQRAWRDVVTAARQYHAEDDVIFDKLVLAIKAATMLRHQGCVYPACEGHELKTLSDLAASHPRPMVRRASAVLLVSVLSENAVVQRRALSSSAVWNLEEWLVVAPKAGLYTSPLKNSLIETLRRAEEALALGLLAGRPSSLPAGIKNRKVLAEIKAGPDGLISAVGVRLRREKTQKPTVSQRTLCKTPQMIPKETEQELWRGGGILKGRDGAHFPNAVFFILTVVTLGTLECFDDDNERVNNGEFSCRNACLFRRLPSTCCMHNKDSLHQALRLLRIRLYASDPSICDAECLAESYSSELDVQTFVTSSGHIEARSLPADVASACGNKQQLEGIAALSDGDKARIFAEHKICLPTEGTFRKDPMTPTWRPSHAGAFQHQIQDPRRKQALKLAACCTQLLVAIEGQSSSLKRTILLRVVANINKALIRTVPSGSEDMHSRCDESKTRLQSALTIGIRRRFMRCRDGIIEELKRATFADLQNQDCARLSKMTVRVTLDRQVEVNDHAQILPPGLDDKNRFVNWHVTRAGCRSVRNKNDFYGAWRSHRNSENRFICLTLELPVQCARAQQPPSRSLRLNAFEKLRHDAIRQLLCILDPCVQQPIHSSVACTTDDGFIAPQVFLGEACIADHGIDSRTELQQSADDTTEMDTTREASNVIDIAQFRSKYELHLRGRKLAARASSILLHKIRNRVNEKSEIARNECLKRIIGVEDNYCKVHMLTRKGRGAKVRRRRGFGC